MAENDDLFDESTSSTNCIVKGICNDEIVVCLEDKHFCEHLLHFGYSKFCQHPDKKEFLFNNQNSNK